MTLPSMVRIFFAIDLSDDAKKKVSKRISMLKKKAEGNAIRWTKMENLHITLQFLAAVDRAHLSDLIEYVRKEVTGKMDKLILCFGDIHLLPNPYRPRVIVLDILPKDPLAALSSWIGIGIKKMHYHVEERPFRAHLTIGRIKHARGINLRFLDECRLPSIENMEVDQIVLFQSVPQPEGSQYTVIEKISLMHSKGVFE